jgi:hypothetical protein
VLSSPDLFEERDNPMDLRERLLVGLRRRQRMGCET